VFGLQPKVKGLRTLIQQLNNLGCLRCFLVSPETYAGILTISPYVQLNLHASGCHCLDRSTSLHSFMQFGNLLWTLQYVQIASQLSLVKLDALYC
jgi:hypothetical protein